MKNKNWFWGAFFIVAAIIIIVNQLGDFAGLSLIPLCLTLLLIPILIKSLFSLNFVGILFPIAFIGIMYSEKLGIQSLTPWPILLTALFGSIGFSLICKRSWPHRYIVDGNFRHKFDGENFEEVVNDPDESVVNYSVKFGSGIKYINSDELTRANLGCSFGALKVYFDNCKISENGAQINLDISFSGVELYLPKGWKLVNGVNVSLGAVEEKNHPIAGEGPTVTLTGSVSLSGVEIVYI